MLTWSALDLSDLIRTPGLRTDWVDWTVKLPTDNGSSGGGEEQHRLADEHHMISVLSGFSVRRLLQRATDRWSHLLYRLLAVENMAEKVWYLTKSIRQCKCKLMHHPIVIYTRRRERVDRYLLYVRKRTFRSRLPAARRIVAAAVGAPLAAVPCGVGQLLKAETGAAILRHHVALVDRHCGNDDINIICTWYIRLKHAFQ